mgnify:CR=1 FL=1
MKPILILSALLLLTGCSDNWGWYVVDPSTTGGANNLKFMISGAYNTILMSVTAILISVVVGLLVALPGLSSKRGWRAFNRTYVEIVRAVPILVLILWVYYGLPQLSGITLNVFWAGVFALALSDSAFQAEIFRGGIQSIGRGQYEAAQSVSLNYRDTMRYIILPQAIRRILPALGDQLGLAVAGRVDEGAVLAHLCRHLADYKRPRKVMILDSLPRLGAGKVDKRALIRQSLTIAAPAAAPKPAMPMTFSVPDRRPIS